MVLIYTENEAARQELQTITPSGLSSETRRIELTRLREVQRRYGENMNPQQRQRLQELERLERTGYSGGTQVVSRLEGAQQRLKAQQQADVSTQPVTRRATQQIIYATPSQRETYVEDTRALSGGSFYAGFGDARVQTYPKGITRTTPVQFERYEPTSPIREEYEKAEKKLQPYSKRLLPSREEKIAKRTAKYSLVTERVSGNIFETKAPSQTTSLTRETSAPEGLTPLPRKKKRFEEGSEYLEPVRQYREGIRYQIRERPLATTALFGLGFVTGGTGTAIASTGTKAALTVQAVGTGAGLFYVGTKGYQLYKTPKGERSFELGKTTTELAALTSGGALGSSVAKSFIKTPEPKLTTTKVKAVEKPPKRAKGYTEYDLTGEAQNLKPKGKPLKFVGKAKATRVRSITADTQLTGDNTQFYKIKTETLTKQSGGVKVSKTGELRIGIPKQQQAQFQKFLGLKGKTQLVQTKINVGGTESTILELSKLTGTRTSTVFAQTKTGSKTDYSLLKSLDLKKTPKLGGARTGVFQTKEGITLAVDEPVYYTKELAITKGTTGKTKTLGQVRTIRPLTTKPSKTDFATSEEVTRFFAKPKTQTPPTPRKPLSPVQKAAIIKQIEVSKAIDFNIKTQQRFEMYSARAKAGALTKASRAALKTSMLSTYQPPKSIQVFQTPRQAGSPPLLIPSYEPQFQFPTSRTGLQPQTLFSPKTTTKQSQKPAVIFEPKDIVKEKETFKTKSSSLTLSSFRTGTSLTPKTSPKLSSRTSQRTLTRQAVRTSSRSIGRPSPVSTPTLYEPPTTLYFPKFEFKFPGAKPLKGGSRIFRYTPTLVGALTLKPLKSAPKGLQAGFLPRAPVQANIKKGKALSKKRKKKPVRRKKK